MNDVHTCNLREPFLSKCIVRREFLEMAGGSFATAGVAKERAEQYKGRVTAYVVIACVVAATGGSIFGYDIGISGSSYPMIL